VVEENNFRTLPENLIASCSIMMQQAINVWSNLSTYGKVASVAALAVPVLFRIRKWFAGGINVHKPDLTGKVVLLTGANTGIGLETAKYLAQLNATIYITVRDDKKGLETIRVIKEASKNDKVDYFVMELSSLKSVRNFVEEYKKRTNNKKIDILIENAGVMMTPYTKTEDGFELQFGVNHLAHFLMTNLLLKENLINENGGRIVVVASRAHRFVKRIRFEDLNWEKDYNKKAAYGQSKLANIYFAKELDKRLKSQGKNIVAVSLHPGVVTTDLGRHLAPPIVFTMTYPIRAFLMKTSFQGAQTTLHCALAPEVANQGGDYFSDCQVTEPWPQALDAEQAEKLWDISEKLVGL
jgi:NAD(P)-dependent dehydrogenase (short-subunit alcohol dehydrogenase family)